MADYTITGPGLPSVLFNPCPASIWLLGGAANCNKQAGHDGMHEVKIEWRTNGG